jgi:integrase
MKTIQDTVAMNGTNRYGRPFSMLDARKQITVLIEELGDAHLHKNKRVSFKTKKERAAFAHEVLDRLRGAGLNIHNLMNLGQRHVQAIVNWMVKENMSAATLQSRFSILRWLATALGKRGLILSPQDYGITRQKFARSRAARSDKSWTGRGVKVDAAIARARELDSWAGTSLLLMKEFGLRLTEAILMEPKVSDKGNSLVVEKGAKGGRMRVVPIETESQRIAIARARESAASNPRGSLVPPGKTPAQARSRIYYILKIVGAEIGQVGLNPHGLRHGFANDKYEEVAGVPPTVRGGPKFVDKAADERARQAIAGALGHRRLPITVAYTGARPRSPRAREADGVDVNRGL